MSTKRLIAALLLFAASLGTSACLAGGTDAACTPLAGTVTTSLADDRGALPQRVWLPVVTAKGSYLRWLTPLNVASRSLSSTELDRILNTKGPDREAAILNAIGDITRAEPNTEAHRFQLLVPPSAIGKAMGDYYAAALGRQGLSARITTMASGDAISTVSSSGAGQVALVELPEFANALGSPLPTTGLSGQLQATASLAATRAMALGSPTAANLTPQVLVTSAFAAAHANITDLSALAHACPGLALSSTVDTAGLAASLKATYGLSPIRTDQKAVESLRAGQIVAAIAAAVQHTG